MDGVGHEIIYEHWGTEADAFRVFRLVWEPYTNRVALHFRSRWEAAQGLIGTPQELIAYLDGRAAGGPPWDSGVPIEARERLARLSPRRQAAESQAGAPP